MSMVVHDVDNCDARHRHAVGAILDLALQNGELRAELRKVAPERADAIDDMHRARNAPQPAPSVPAGAEMAEVLEGLVERWRREADGYGDHTWSRGLMAQIKRECADELEATSGARAAGGERKSREQIRVESAAACWEAQAQRPIRDRIASLLRESDQKDVVESVIADAGDPNVGYCGGQTFDPPCGGCAGCLVAQTLYYLPSWGQYLAVADQALAMDAAAPPTPAAPGVAGYVLGTCFRDTQGNRHREGWSGDWYPTRERADEELAKWPGDKDHEVAVFEVHLAYDPHQHVWCPTCGDYPGGRCTDHTGRVCCITHGTRLVLLAPSGADGGGW